MPYYQLKSPRALCLLLPIFLAMFLFNNVGLFLWISILICAIILIWQEWNSLEQWKMLPKILMEKLLNMEIIRENRLVAQHIFPYIWARGDFWVKFQFCIVLLLLILERLAMFMVPLYHKWIVDALAGPNPLCYDLIIKSALLDIIEQKASSFRYRLIAKVTKTIKADIELDLFHHLHRLPLQWHLKKKTGEITEIIQNGVSSIWSIFDIWLDVIPGFFDIFVAIAVLMINFDVHISAVTSITMTLFLAVSIASSKLGEWFYKEQKRVELDYHSSIVDSLINYETIKYYCAEDYEYARFKQAKEKKLRLSAFSSFYTASTDFIGHIILNIGLICGTIMLAERISGGVQGFSAGDFVLFGTFVSNLTSPILKFSWHFDNFRKSFIDVNLVMKLLGEEAESTIGSDGDGTGFGRMQPISGPIEFRNVSFSYVPKKPVLHDLSFRIEAGQTLALVGESGSGKSTIVRLLFRLIEPHSGQILFDGQPIRQIGLRQFREAIGVVPQETVLFNDTIGYNIRYGRREADMGEVEKAAKAAQIHKFIMGHPEGYKCKVGNRGLKLSGGEKQRVAIARTILKKPNYILLDEATSSLDSKTERAIQRNLEELCRNRTCVVVAHRLSTVMNAHKILVLDKGKIVESGSHAELVAQNGAYAEMWRIQNGPCENNKEKEEEAEDDEKGKENCQNDGGGEWQNADGDISMENGTAPSNGGIYARPTFSVEGSSDDSDDDFDDFY